LEESPQIDAADGGSGGIKAMAHLNSLTHLGDQLGGDMEDFGLAADEHGNLKLRMEVLAVGAMAVGASAPAFAFDEGAGEHIAEGAEAANEPAAGFEIGVAGHFLSDSNYSVRRKTNQGLLEICNNEPGGRTPGKVLRINGFGVHRTRAYGITERNRIIEWQGLQMRRIAADSAPISFHLLSSAFICVLRWHLAAAFGHETQEAQT
jgi:hypothetical protein